MEVMSEALTLKERTFFTKTKTLKNTPTQHLDIMCAVVQAEKRQRQCSRILLGHPQMKGFGVSP